MASVERDLEMLQSPDEWPRWPVLPVVNRENTDKMGIVWDGDPTVYLSNLYDLKGGLKKDVVAGLEKEEYLDWEGLASDWRVD